MIKYNDEQIATAKLLLDNIHVNGVDNCKRIVMLSQILESGIKEPAEE